MVIKPSTDYFATVIDNICRLAFQKLFYIQYNIIKNIYLKFFFKCSYFTNKLKDFSLGCDDAKATAWE